MKTRWENPRQDPPPIRQPHKVKENIAELLSKVSAILVAPTGQSWGALCVAFPLKALREFADLASQCQHEVARRMELVPVPRSGKVRLPPADIFECEVGGEARHGFVLIWLVPLLLGLLGSSQASGLGVGVGGARCREGRGARVVLYSSAVKQKTPARIILKTQ